jgi:hypothetical protein
LLWQRVEENRLRKAFTSGGMALAVAVSGLLRAMVRGRSLRCHAELLSSLVHCQRFAEKEALNLIAVMMS